MEERLQKLLAAAGVASRRAAEQLILSGRITVNGAAVRELGVRADPERDDIRLDGRPVQRSGGSTYLMMHKPAGYTSTAADPHAARTVMQLLPKGTPRVYPVGRLDRDSEGLLIFTDDGALAQRLTHPRYHIPREYGVLVRGTVDDDALRRLRAGAVVDGRRVAPAEVEPAEPPPGIDATAEYHEPGTPARRRISPTGEPELWLRMVLHEGRKRQIRVTCERAGLDVLRLVRLSIGPLLLGGLAPGKVRPLRKAELAALRRAAGLPDVPEQPPTSARDGAGPAPTNRRAGPRSGNRPSAPAMAAVPRSTGGSRGSRGAGKRVERGQEAARRPRDSGASRRENAGVGDARPSPSTKAAKPATGRMGNARRRGGPARGKRR